MKKIIIILLLVSVTLLTASAQNNMLVIENVTVIDVINNKEINGQTVVIEGNKIASIKKKVAPPKHARVIDASGKFMIPALWDMHTHTLRAGRIPYFFPLFIANGVMGIRDMGSDLSIDEIVKIRDDVETGTILGPRIMCFTGRVLNGPPNKRDTILFTYPSGKDAIQKMAQTYKEKEVPFIKIYDMLSKENFYTVAAESKSYDIPFAGHIPFAVTATEASDAGQRCIEHLSDILLSVSSNENELRAEQEKINVNDAIQGNNRRREIAYEAMKNYSKAKVLSLSARFVRNDTWQCPTLRNLQIVTSGSNLSLLMNDDRVKYFQRPIQENWKRTLLLRTIGDSLQRASYFQQILRLVSDMHKAGVKMLAGTDLSSTFQMPGFSLHDELGLMVAAGMTPCEALQTATINAAIFLRKEKEFGSVDVGKIADMVLLSDNPLNNIEHSKRIDAVIVNGKLFQRKDLDQMLAQVEKLVKDN